MVNAAEVAELNAVTALRGTRMVSEPAEVCGADGADETIVDTLGIGGI